MAAARGAGGPNGALGQHGPGQDRVRGRGALPECRAPGMGALAARHPDPGLPDLVFRRPGHLPAYRSHRRQPRGLTAARLLSLVFMLGVTSPRMVHDDPVAAGRTRRLPELVAG